MARLVLDMTSTQPICFLGQPLGHVKLNDSTFQAFNDLENRKQIKPNANLKTNAVNNPEHDSNEKKAPKIKSKKKTVSPTESPKAVQNKPQTFEQAARQVQPN